MVWDCFWLGFQEKAHLRSCLRNWASHIKTPRKDCSPLQGCKEFRSSELHMLGEGEREREEGKDGWCQDPRGSGDSRGQSAWNLERHHLGAIPSATVCFGYAGLRGISCSEAPGILIPWPGIEPMSPALEVKFLTTGPPGKSPKQLFDLESDLIWFTI